MQPRSKKILAGVVIVVALLFACVIASSLRTGRTRIVPATVYRASDRQTWPHDVKIGQLTKNPAAYAGTRLYFRGEAFNVREDARGTTFQMWVASGDARTAVYVSWPDGRADWLRDTVPVQVYAEGAGEITGENAFGARVSQPALRAWFVDRSYIN